MAKTARPENTRAPDRDLEGERKAHQATRAEVERLKHQLDLLERFGAAMSDSPTLEQLLQRVLVLFGEVACTDVAVARLREADALVARAAIGLAEEVTQSYSVRLEDAVPVEGTLGKAPLAAACWSEVMRARSVRTLYVLRLERNGELHGAVYLGARHELELSEAQRALLQTLAGRTAAVVVGHLASQAREHALRSRDEVLSVVAHDLRNPLNVIKLAATSLMHRLPDTMARRPLERILRGVERADRLIRDLLEINAIEGHRFSIEARPVETANMLLGALESQQGLVASASMILAADLSPDLPQIEADEERILEVLENLIGNAVKFTGVNGTVTIGAAPRGKELLIWVKDTGPGIAPDHLPHLFDRFWQARKRDRRGTGLGLTICKAIVEAHGGKIWAESKLGEGTTMYFTLPAKPMQQARPQPVASILMVDDRPENLLSLKSILERPDYRLVTATSGEEALRLALKENFAVALIDIAMPGMNGFEVAIHMKELERSRHIPIIFITAFGDDPKEIHQAYQAGGADYLVKPLDTEIVKKKVAVFVELSRTRMQTEFSERSPKQTHDEP